jgi:basic membrane protein A
LRGGKFAALIASTSLLLSALTLPAHAAISIKIAIAYDIGGRGDHGINDSAAIGVDAIKKKFGLTALSVREMVTNGTESDRESRLQFLADANYNLIVAIGPGYAKALGVVAIANPNTQFALINDASVGNLNLSDMIFSNSNGAYLAGVLAGAATKSKKVAFIAPTLFAPYVAAFQLGLKSVQPKATVVSQLIDSDPATATKSAITAGADIVFSEWSTGPEVQDTVAKLSTSKHPVYLIGVNPDQYFLLDKAGQKVLIGAVSKHIDVAVRDVMNAAIVGESIVDILNGTDGIFGHMYTVKDGGESMALTTLGSRYSVKVAAAVAKLKSGKIKLP